MNKLLSLMVLAALALAGLCGYWYVNPNAIPRFIRDNLPEVKMPSSRSPMTNFRPPQF